MITMCSRGRQQQVKCAFCGRPAAFYCDYPVSDKKTCDKPLCKKCRAVIGDEVDYCPKHANQGGLFDNGK